MVAKQKRSFNLVKVGYMKIQQSFLSMFASISGSTNLRKRAICNELECVRNGLRKLDSLEALRERFKSEGVDWNSNLNSEKKRELEKCKGSEGELKQREAFLLREHKELIATKIKSLLNEVERLQGSSEVAIDLRVYRTDKNASSAAWNRFD